MNRITRATLIKRNDTARLVEPHSKRERNTVRINSGNTFKHEFAKFFLCWKLKQEGSEFISEAIFQRRYARTDVLDLDECVAYEVMHSENQQSIDAKKDFYPKEVTIVAVKAEDLIQEALKTLKGETDGRKEG